MVPSIRAFPVWLGTLGSAAALRRLGGLLAGCFLLGLASSFVIPFLSLWGTRTVGMTPFAFGMFMTI
ncbi:MAG TPA: hypothetical protein VMG12_17620, partial [Polyangiaceae bacterium]|nr:hypothetical protein [Polyangiaceae bacterium]